MVFTGFNSYSINLFRTSWTSKQWCLSMPWIKLNTRRNLAEFYNVFSTRSVVLCQNSWPCCCNGLIKGTLRSNDTDATRRSKTICLISKTTTSHVHHTFLYISFPFLHDYDVKMPNFAFYGGRKQATTKFYFSFWAWIWSLEIQLQEGSPKWVGMIAIKTERTQIHFLSDVLVVVASLDLKVPKNSRHQLDGWLHHVSSYFEHRKNPRGGSL